MKKLIVSLLCLNKGKKNFLKAISDSMDLEHKMGKCDLLPFIFLAHDPLFFYSQTFCYKEESQEKTLRDDF